MKHIHFLVYIDIGFSFNDCIASTTMYMSSNFNQSPHLLFSPRPREDWQMSGREQSAVRMHLSRKGRPTCAPWAVTYPFTFFKVAKMNQHNPDFLLLSYNTESVLFHSNLTTTNWPSGYFEANLRHVISPANISVCIFKRFFYSVNKTISNYQMQKLPIII